MSKEEHRKRFNSQAGNYRSDSYPGRYNCLLFVLDYLNPGPDDTVLDIGCGPGQQLIEMANCIKHGVGIDLSDEMISIAEKNAEDFRNIKFKVLSADTVPKKFSEIGFNKVYSNYALHHLSDDKKSEVIKNIADILVPGGVFILGDLMLSEGYGKFSSLFDYVGFGPGSDTPSTVEEIERMFEDAGFIYKKRLLSPVNGVIIGEIRNQKCRKTV